MYVRIILHLLLPFLGVQVLAQNIYSHFSLGLQGHQVKDQFNYGLVYTGLVLKLDYKLSKQWDKQLFTYQGGVALGANFNKGTGLNLQLAPLHIAYQQKVATDSRWAFGGYTSWYYLWQAYPDLQSGHLKWLGSIEIGPQVSYTFPLAQRQFQLQLASSLAGWAARPAPIARSETYFYGLSFNDFAVVPLQQMCFGSWNRFNHSQLKLAWLPAVDRRLSLAYVFDYYGHFIASRYHYIGHELRLGWRLGKIGEG